MILIILIYHITKFWFEAMDRDFDIMPLTAKDYTVHVSGLGNDVTEQEVKEFFEKHGRFDGKPAKVVKVVFAYKIREYIENIRKLEEYAESLRMIEEDEKQGIVQTSGCCKRRSHKKEKIKQEMAKISKIINKYEEDVRTGVRRDLFIGQAFITFETIADARAVEYKYGREWFSRMCSSAFRKCCCCFSKIKRTKFLRKNIKAKIAHEPNDIFWENLEVSYFERLKRTLTILTINFMLNLIMCFLYMGFKSLNIIQYQNQNTEEYLGRSSAISISVSIMIITFNFILAWTTRFYTSSFDKPYSVTAYNISVASKLDYAMFFNLTVTIWAPRYVFLGVTIATDATYILILNAILSPLMQLFSPMVYIHKLRMKKVEKAPYISQHDANLLLENPTADMVFTYASISRAILLTFIYAPIVPLAFIFSALAIILECCTFKYLLLRRYSWPKKLSGDLPKAVFNKIPWLVVVYSSMNVVFTRIPVGNDEYELAQSWMYAIFVYYFIISKILNSFCIYRNMRKWEKQSSKKYYEVALTFVEDYDRLNPITASQANITYAQLMLINNVVNIDQFEQMTQVFKLDQDDVFKNLRKYAKGRESIRDIEKRNLSFGINGSGNMHRDEAKPKKSLKNIAIEMHKFADSKITPILKRLRKKYESYQKRMEDHPTYNYNSYYYNSRIFW